MKPQLLIKAWLFAVCAAAMACNSGNNSSNQPASGSADTSNAPASDQSASTNPKGIGKYQNIQLTHPLDPKMVAAGKNIYDVKCGSCHKLTSEKLVGPGWRGVTDRRTPEWIMNFVTNTEEMINRDTAAQKLLEVCLVKMPNQNLSEPDARSVLEFMRSNDAKK